MQRFFVCCWLKAKEHFNETLLWGLFDDVKIILKKYYHQNKNFPKIIYSLICSFLSFKVNFNVKNIDKIHILLTFILNVIHYETHKKAYFYRLKFILYR